MTAPTRWITATNSVLGLWLIASSVILSAPAVNRWNDVVVGTAIVILAGSNHYYERTQTTVSQRAAGINAILGGWLLIAPFIYGSSGVLLWNDVAIGVLIMAFSGYNAYAAPRTSKSNDYTSCEDA